MLYHVRTLNMISTIIRAQEYIYIYAHDLISPDTSSLIALSLGYIPLIGPCSWLFPNNNHKTIDAKWALFPYTPTSFWLPVQ